MSTWRLSLPLVLLACLGFGCETPVPDDQIHANVSSAANGDKNKDKDKKPTSPTKPKPTGAGTPVSTGANTTPTSTDATPTTPAPNTTPAPSTSTTTAPPVTDPPPVTTTPPPADPPPQAAQEDLVEIDCCIGAQFIACVGTTAQTCGEMNVDTDCLFDPTFDDLCQ